MRDTAGRGAQEKSPMRTQSLPRQGLGDKLEGGARGVHRIAERTQPLTQMGDGRTIESLVWGA
ncbi:MAG: hypothetical protein LBN04_00465 [Oscillospiraceae bacterium]|jgi:hypothetical protein|nr:hypothetical protein [Oscillospiraceae bacterium]